MNEMDYMYFSELARTLSFSRAAENLFITQSALSRCIAKLENELSAKLFIRDRHDVRLTPAGEVLLEKWSMVEKANHMLRNAVMHADGLSTKETVRIGIQHGRLIPGYMVKAIKEFQVSSSPVAVELVSLSYRDLFRQLREGMIDMALAFSFPFTETEGLESILLHREQCCVAVSPMHPLASVTDTEERLNMLRTMDLLCSGREHQNRFFPFLIAQCRKNGFEPAGVKYYPTNMDLANALLMEKGFLVLNRTELMKGAFMMPLEKSDRVEFRAWRTEGEMPAALALLMERLRALPVTDL